MTMNDVRELRATRTEAAVVVDGVEDAGERRTVDVASALFHSLSDASRVRIVRHLLLGEHRVVDLVAHLGLAQSTVSAHLACLRGCGLVDSRAQGRASVFSLRHPTETIALLAAAEDLLGVTGEAVTLCTTTVR